MPLSPSAPIPDDYTPPDPKNYATSAKVRERALKVVMRGLDGCEAARGQKREDWLKAYRAFRAIRSMRNYRGRANITDPEPSKAIETVNSRMEEAVLSERPMLRGRPRERMDRAQVEAAESLIQMQLDAADGERILQSFLKNLVILGTQILRVEWEEKFRHVRRRAPAKDEMGEKYVKSTSAVEPVFLGPRPTIVDIDDFYVPDLLCESVEDQDFVIERRIVSYHDLAILAKAKEIANFKPVKPNGFSRSSPFADVLRQAKSHALGQAYTDSTNEGASTDRKVEILAYEGWFDLYDNGTMLPCWIWVANGRDVVKVQENQYWHCIEHPTGNGKSYVTSHYIKAPGEFYGINIFEWIESMWAELCDTHNQNLDNKNMILCPMIVAGAGAGLTEQRLLVSPGRVIRSQGLAGEIQPFVFPDMTATGWQAAGLMRAMMRETTGATDLLQGGAGGTDKATIYTGMLNEASARMKHPLRNIFNMALGPLAQKMYGLNTQYAPPEMIVRIIGSSGFDWVPVRPQDLGKKIDFIGIGSGAISNSLQRNFGLERFFATMGPLIQAGALKANVPELAKRYWTDAFGYQDADRLFGDQGPRKLEPAEEHLMLTQRQNVDPHPADDDVGHIREHIEFYMQSRDPLVRRMTETHIEDHKAQAQAKQQMMQMQGMQQMQQMVGQQGAPAGGPPAARPGQQGDPGGQAQAAAPGGS